MSSWLTHPKQVKTASEESLRRVLVTHDGAGKTVKAAALEELLYRAREEWAVRTCPEMVHASREFRLMVDSQLGNL